MKPESQLQDRRRRPRSLVTPLMLAAVLGLAPGKAANAHEEPPKTGAEQAEHLRQRSLFAACRVKTQQLHVHQPDAQNAATETAALLTNHFNQTGDLIEQVIHDSTCAERTVSIYDESGIWLEELTYRQGAYTERAVFMYGGDGLIRSIRVFDAAGDQTESLLYDYPLNSNLIRAEKRDQSGSLAYSVQYLFEPGSAFARQIEAVQTGAGGELKTRTRNKFAAGLRVTKEVFGADGALSHVFSYGYTPDGDFKEIVRRSPAGVVESRQVFDYRPDRLPATVTNLDPEGKTTRLLSYSYEYFALLPGP